MPARMALHTEGHAWCGRSIPTDRNLVLRELGLGRAPGRAAGGFPPHFWERENLRTRVDRRSRMKTVGVLVDKKAQNNRAAPDFPLPQVPSIYSPSLAAEPRTHAFPACSPSKHSELRPSPYPFPHQFSTPARHRPAFLF